MSNRINNTSASTLFVQPHVRSTETPKSSKPVVFAETQLSIFEAPAKASVAKPLTEIPVLFTRLKSNAKKALPSNFSSPEESESLGFSEPSQATKKIMTASHSGNQNQSDDASDIPDETRLVYHNKLSQLNQICVPGMSATDAEHAKELAMQVVLCTNAATLVQKKSTRELSEVIGHMVQKLAQGGVSLPADAESLLGLLKSQSDQLPNFLISGQDTKDSIRGHLLPLLLLALRRHSPVLPTPDLFRMYGAAA
jgi:hypothetical protein